jgi:hypothetical protein
MILQARSFVVDFVSRFTVSPTDTRFAMIMYNDGIAFYFDFTAYNTSADVQRAILAQGYNAGLNDASV